MHGQETQMVTRGNLEVSDLGPGRSIPGSTLRSSHLDCMS